MDGRICSRCVMDSGNPKIVFNDEGICNCCTDAVSRMSQEWVTGEAGRRRLSALADRLRRSGRGQRYDAIIGLSGGVDSAYLAHILRTEYNLKLLAVHVDGGWNTEAAVHNIEAMVRSLRIDLHTFVVEWEEMRDLQLAFLRASVLNQDIPQDHAFFTTLYRTARSFGIRNFLSGVNFSSECIVPPGWGYPAMDGLNLRAIHARFGDSELRSYPVMGVMEYVWMTRIRRQLSIHRPLNYLDYNKTHAKALLVERYSYKDYGGKHNESRFTKFYQDVYLPARYGFDKRRLHLSSQIVSGQLTRQEALKELATPICDPEQARHELKFISKKLCISLGELRSLMAKPPVEHEDYPNSAGLYRIGAGFKRLLRRSGGVR